MLAASDCLSPSPPETMRWGRRGALLQRRGRSQQDAAPAARAALLLAPGGWLVAAGERAVGWHQHCVCVCGHPPPDGPWEKQIHGGAEGATRGGHLEAYPHLQGRKLVREGRWGGGGSPTICLSETLVSRAPPPHKLARGPDVVALPASCPRPKGGRELVTLKGGVLVLG